MTTTVQDLFFSFIDLIKNSYFLNFSDGTKELCDLLMPLDSSEHNEWIEKVIDAIQNLSVPTNLVSKEVIQQAAQVNMKVILHCNVVV